MKLHLAKTENKKETLCGGRISGIKSTGKKQFIVVDAEWFESEPVSERCIKCHAAHELSKQTQPA